MAIVTGEKLSAKWLAVMGSCKCVPIVYLYYVCDVYVSVYI